MIIIGCDFHTRYQQIAMANDETGELHLERRLDHQSGEAPSVFHWFREKKGPSLSVERTRKGIRKSAPGHPPRSALDRSLIDMYHWYVPTVTL